jgi:uncharacterized protein (DUF1015 family)
VDFAAETREPIAAAISHDGVTHRLWALTDPAEHAAIAADLATRTALIADGHHRYAAYEQLRAEARDADGGAVAGPWDFGLAFIVDADAYPLRLGPIHRVLPRLDPAEAAALAAEAFTVTEFAAREPADAEPTGQTPTGRELADAEPTDAELAGQTPTGREPADAELADAELADCEPSSYDLPAALAALDKAGREGTAFLLAGADRAYLLCDPDQMRIGAAMPPGTSPRWQALDAAVMQELLLAGLWSIKDNERDVLISHDAGEAVRMAAETGGTAVLCNPMPLAAVMDIAAHGEKVPRKSTSFGPKPLTGLVLRMFDS